MPAGDRQAAPSTAPAERRFTEDEVGQILGRAAELQERVARTRASGALSLSEIKQIAAEVGIEAELVDRAASSLPAVRTRSGSALVGGAWEWSEELVVSGEVAEEDMGRVLDAIRAAVGRGGDVETHFGSLEWTEDDDGMGPFVVRVTPRDGRTRVEAMVRRGEQLAVIAILSPVGGLLAGGALVGMLEPSGVLGTLGLVGVGIGSSVMLARGFWARSARRWESRVRAVLDVVGRAVKDVAK